MSHNALEHDLSEVSSCRPFVAHSVALLEVQVTDSAQNGATNELRERLMQEDADLNSEERTQIHTKLEEIANSGLW